jgi:hypothetical protein
MIDLRLLGLLEMLPLLADGRARLEDVYAELRTRPCLDAHWKPGDPVPVLT